MYGFTINVDGNSVQQMKQIEAELQKMGVVATIETNKVQGSFHNLASGLSGFGAMLGITLGGAAITAFGSKIIDAGTKVEDTLIGLTTSLRDAGAAHDVINKTMEDAENTPFDFSILMDGNRALISTGLSAEKAREDILSLANAVAASGKGNDELNRMDFNLQQIKNNGVATAVDIKQFGIAGINIYKVLADYTHKNVEQIKGMEITYDQLTGALKKAAGAGGLYENALKNMSEQSTSVKMSNLGDSVFKLSVTMFNDLKPAIEGIIAGMSDFVKSISEAWNFLMNLPELYKENKTAIDMLAGAVVSGTAAWIAYTTWTGRATIASQIMTAYATIETAVLYGLGVAAEFVAAVFLSTVGIIIGVAVAIGAAIMYAWNHFETFRAVLTGVWEYIKVWASAIVDIFKGLSDVIQGVFTFDTKQIAKGFSTVAGAMQDVGKKAGEAYQRGFETGRNNFRLQKLEASNPGIKITTGQKGSTLKKEGKDPNAVTQSAINTSALSGGKGGLGESKVINIRIDTMQKVEVKDGKGLEQHSQNAIEILTRTLNNLAYSQGSSM